MGLLAARDEGGRGDEAARRRAHRAHGQEHGPRDVGGLRRGGCRDGPLALRRRGVRVRPDRAFTGLDLDHVLTDGALDPEYRWVVDEAGTYTEVSPSGDGLHLIFRGPKPDWAERSRKGPARRGAWSRCTTATGTSP